ncbi:MAG TPA: YajQ family cyclic di-GMP-binding protein [Gammaproteobacteria bacterium]|nr:YajQ family cyclic di-GMP-binding protein [Gammaproteobacteria bacterium]
MPSFDIVSEIDNHELTNALDIAQRKIDNRFDFKGTPAKIAQEKDSIVLYAENDFQLQQIQAILNESFSKRNLDIRSLKSEGPIHDHAHIKEAFTTIQGLNQDAAKKLTKHIKSTKIKVQATIQGEKLRVTGKKRDDLQSIINELKELSFEQPLQFNNFRD